jgi:CRISPR-associated protein (TIGR02584 family)
MGRNVLISSLGASPGVVTGTVDAIKFRDDVEIHKVITISTSDDQIAHNAVEQILRPEFEDADFYPRAIEYENYAIEAEDIITPEDNKDFLQKFVEHLHENIRSDQTDNIYVSLAGGRKTMASLVFIGVKLIVDCYRIHETYSRKLKRLTHLLVDDPDIEEFGNTEDLMDAKRDNEDLFLKCMHPINAFGEEEAEKRVRLVDLSGVFKNAAELQEECGKIRDGRLTPEVLAKLL